MSRGERHFFHSCISLDGNKLLPERAELKHEEFFLISLFTSLGLTSTREIRLTVRQNVMDDLAYSNIFSFIVYAQARESERTNERKQKKERKKS